MDTPLSLLERLCEEPTEEAWRRLDYLYRPLIRRWVLRGDPTLGAEVEDVIQEVMKGLVEELPRFRHNRRKGAFRAYLRQMTLHRLQAFWRSRGKRPLLLQEDSAHSPLMQLADAASDLSRLWEEDHNQHVMRGLLALLQPEFNPTVWKAFTRQLFDDAEPAAVAAELGIQVSAVYLAKSRILKRLRQEGQGLLD
jgi:RNA polymerase sigma-70 factor (ECF subfamily)